MNERLLSIFNLVMQNNGLPLIDNLDVHLRFNQDLNLDSIMLAELTVRIEDEFGIDVFENGMIFTVGDVLSIING